MTQNDDERRRARDPALFSVEEKTAAISRIVQTTGLPLVGSDEDLWNGICDADIARDFGTANEAGKAAELKQLVKILKQVTDLQKELDGSSLWSRLGRHEQAVEDLKHDLQRHVEQIRGPWRINGLGPDTAAVQALAGTFEAAFGKKATMISDSGDVGEDGSSDALRGPFAPFVQAVFGELGWGAGAVGGITAKGVKSRLYQKLKLPTAE